MIPLPIAIIISIVWDFLDFTIGRIPGFGTLFDIIGTFLAVMLYGASGTLALWEIIDVTDQFDAEIPTLTAIGILTYITQKR